MNRRTARLLRAGILAARDPELRQYVHLAHPLVREACRREMLRIPVREHIARLDARIAKLDAAQPEQAEHLRRFYE